MQPQCSVCRHPRVTAIDTDLLSGAVPVAALAARHGLSTSALYRHRTHLRARLAQARELAHSLMLAELMIIRVAALGQTRQLLDQTLGENPAQALAALGLITRLTGAIARDARELQDPVIYHLLAGGAWTGSASALPSNPNHLEYLRDHVPGWVQSPCPDAEAPPAADHDGENPLPGAGPPPADDLTTGNINMIEEPSPSSPGENQVGKRWESGGNAVGKRWKSGGTPADMGWDAGGGLPGGVGNLPGTAALRPPALGPSLSATVTSLEAELQALQAELRGALTPDAAKSPAPPPPAGANSKNGKKTKKKGKSKR